MMNKEFLKILKRKTLKLQDAVASFRFALAANIVYRVDGGQKRDMDTLLEL